MDQIDGMQGVWMDDTTVYFILSSDDGWECDLVFKDDGVFTEFGSEIYSFAFHWYALRRTY